MSQYRQRRIHRGRFGISIDPDKISKQAAKALDTIVNSGKSRAKLWQGAHNGMHEFVDETGQSLSQAKDYYGKALAGKVNLGSDTKDFASAISQAART